MANDEQQSIRNWRTLGVAAAGIVQISAGVYLQACSAVTLAVVGNWLVCQGSCDIVFAIRTALNDSFSWTEYRNEKLINAPFTAFSVGAESWLQGGAENAFRRFTAAKVTRKIGIASARGVTVFIVGKALKIAKDAIFESFHEEIDNVIDKIISHEFAYVRTDIEELFRLDPSNAENLISGAFADVVTNINEDESTGDRIRNAAVEFVPTLVELSLLLLSNITARDFSDRSVNFAKFITTEAVSVNESRLFARNFMRSLQKAVATCRRNQPSQHTSQQTDPEIVEEFLAKFKRRIKALMARKVGEQFRRGLLLASAQSFVPGLIADAAEKAGF